MIVVISGPGGVGKGTIVDRLVSADPKLWLSRSWTTRPRRPGERADAYTFVSREEFGAAIAAGRFLEHQPFLDHLYGTPLPDPPADLDLVLEIEVKGAAQVKSLFPEAVVVLVVPPSEEALAERLRKRGESEQRLEARLRVGREEVEAGRRLAGHVVVNDDLDRAVAEVAGIIAAHRARGE